MADIELMIIAWTRAQNPELDAPCLKTTRFPRLGEMTVSKCYDPKNKPNILTFIDEVHSEYYDKFASQITFFLSFATGYSISEVDKMHSDGKSVKESCFYLVCIFGIDWKFGKAILDEKPQKFPKCEHHYPEFESLCGEKCIADFIGLIDKKMYNMYGALPHIVTEWNRKIQPKFENILYVHNLGVVGKV